MMSAMDLRKKLRTKYCDEEGLIEKVMDEMERVQLINDKRYTEQLINHLIQRNIGRLKIKLEARKRGLELELVESALMNSDFNEEEWCRRAHAEKIKSLHEPDPRKKKQKLMNFLRNRGFTDSVIYQILKN